MKNKILALVIHTKNQLERVDNIINTWGNDIDFVFYSDHEDLDKKIIKVSDDSTYKSNEIKFVSVVRTLPEKYLDYDWFLFVDNDTFVNTKLIDNFCSFASQDKIYGQKINCWPQDKNLYFLSGGGGILVPKAIYQQLRKNLFLYGTGYCDVSLGICCEQANITIQDSPFFRGQPPEFYGIDIKNVDKYATFHYIKDIETMSKLYNLMENKNV